jgi:hypothetical protein
MRGSSRPHWRVGKRRYIFQMRFHDEPREVAENAGAAGTCEVRRAGARAGQPSQVDGLGHAWAKLIVV